MPSKEIDSNRFGTDEHQDGSDDFEDMSDCLDYDAIERMEMPTLEPVIIDAGSKSTSNDFWCFRRMISPILIQIFFWFGVVACIIVGIAIITDGQYHTFQQIYGFALIILGPIVLRILCEFLILFFRMNETLTDMLEKIRQK